MNHAINQTEYKDSPVGRIPASWKFRKLNSVLDVIDSLHSTPQFASKGYPMVRVTDIKEGNLKLENSMRVSKEDYLKFTKRYKPILGDIVLSRVGSYGVSSYVDTHEKFCMGQNTVVIHSKNLDQKFAYYLLNAYIVKNQIENEVAGSGYKSLSLASINALILLIPSKEEQQKIATILTSVDEVIEKTESQIRKLQDLKKGMMQELLTQGIGHTQFKDSPVGRIPKGWDCNKISNVVDNLDSKRVPLKREDRSEMQGIYPYYGASGIIDYVNDYLFDGTFILLGEDGENVLSRNLPLAFIVSGKVWVNNHAHVLKPKSFMEIRYLCEFLESIDYKNIISGSAQPKINKSELSKIHVPVPPLPEQEKIASILSSIDSKIEVKRQKLQQTQNLKKSLMQDLLTGKVRVSVN